MIIQFITYRAKLLNAYWFRQRAFFLNFPSMEGKITRSRLVEHAVSAFSWLYEKFCSEFSTARSLQFLIF